LAGRQLVVGDEYVVAGLAPGVRKLLGLALPDIPVGIDMAAVLPFRTDYLGTRSVRKAGELGERILGRPATVIAGVDGDEEGLLDRGDEIDELTGHGRSLRPACGLASLDRPMGELDGTVERDREGVVAVRAEPV